jgi:DNA-binding SARP family transcriptional activator
VEFRLLGDVEARDDTGNLIRMGARQRAVLAVLLYRINSVVSRQEMAGLVWGRHPADRPLTAERLLTDYVSRLRVTLARGGTHETVRLLTYPAGYSLRGRASNVDWHRCRDLVRQALSHRPSQPIASSMELLRAALDLWRGPALADLGAPSLDPIKEGMTNLRLLAAEELAIISLDTGHSAAVVDHLDELGRMYPGRERLATLLVRALHRTGQREAAITVYQRTRSYLVDVLGLDPNDALEREYRALLAGAPPLVDGQ